MMCTSAQGLSTKQGRYSEGQEGEGIWYLGCQLELPGGGRCPSRFEQNQECEFVNTCSCFVSPALFPFFLVTAPPFTLEDSPFLRHVV